MTARHPRGDSDDANPPSSPGDYPHHPPGWGLCSGFMTQLPISGAVISIVDRGGHRSTVAATDTVAARMDELDLELGTGPLSEAIATLAPQLIEDIRESSLNPVVGEQLESLGVRAMFALPVTMGAATVGAVGLYRTTPGRLSDEALGVAVRLARAAAVPAVREALRMAGQPNATRTAGAAPELRREVHQATGMISAQLDVTTTDAFLMLRAFAVSSERSLSEVAGDVVGGGINFLDLD